MEIEEQTLNALFHVGFPEHTKKEHQWLLHSYQYPWPCPCLESIFQTIDRIRAKLITMPVFTRIRRSTLFRVSNLQWQVSDRPLLQSPISSRQSQCLESNFVTYPKNRLENYPKSSSLLPFSWLMELSKLLHICFTTEDLNSDNVPVSRISMGSLFHFHIVL